MRKHKNKPRLYVTSPLGASASLELGGDQTHYLRAVLRMAPGEQVRLFNGKDGEWVCEIEVITKKRTTLKALEKLREQIKPGDCWYLFAPLKQARLDYIAQKATEMGASRIQPVKTEYSQVSRVNEARMQANAAEAAEQCELLNVPQITPVQKLETILQDWPHERVLFFCNETEQSSSPLETLQTYKNNPLSVLIGPEGGFSPAEIKLLMAKDFVVPISLGPRILRADTAGVAALAVIQATIGDW